MFWSFKPGDFCKQTFHRFHRFFYSATFHRVKKTKLLVQIDMNNIKNNKYLYIELMFLFIQ